MTVQEKVVQEPAEDWRVSALWQKLEAMRIEPPGAALSFSARLARENDWARSHADAVVLEYKRFLYLAARSAVPVTPPEDVDQAWHLHLAYSRHYWNVLCYELLERPLHHGPTEGGEAEGRRYRQQYEDTLALYRSTFGCEPPASIWPRVGLRFSARSVRVDRSRYWVVPKAVPARLGLAGVTALVAGCSLLTAASAAGDGGMEFADFVWAILGCVFIVAAVVSLVRRVTGRERGDGACGTGLGGCGGGGGGDSGCGGGCGGD